MVFNATFNNISVISCTWRSVLLVEETGVPEENQRPVRLFEICFHFAGHRSSTQEFFSGPSEFLPDLHFLCKIV